jgi:uroporphyrinogen-III decarboxylase
MIVPHLQRIVDFCHDNGMSYEIHMCGVVNPFIPIFVECGIDMWAAIEPRYYDTDAIVKQYKNERLIFGISGPDIDINASEEEMRAAAKAFVDEYKDCNITVSYFKMDPEWPGYHPGLQDAVYEYSRIAFQDAE